MTTIQECGGFWIFFFYKFQNEKLRSKKWNLVEVVFSGMFHSSGGGGGGGNGNSQQKGERFNGKWVDLELWRKVCDQSMPLNTPAFTEDLE